MTECPDVVVGWRTVGGTRKPCLRRGGPRGPIVDGMITWWKVTMDKSIYDAKVFKVTLSDDRAKAWNKSPKEEYVVARDIGYATKITEQRYSRIVERYTGLAKESWSRAMMLASDRPATFSVTPKAKQILTSNIVVTKNLNKGNALGTSGEYSIHVEDNLNYAGTALKGGESYVTTAMMKACNSVNGYINNYIQSHGGDRWFADENWQTAEAPFPPEAFGD